MTGTILVTAVKLIGGAAVSTGVGAVTKNLIKMTTPNDISKLTKACITFGGIVVGGLAGKAASNQLGNTVDTAYGTMTEAVAFIKKHTQKTPKEETTEAEETEA